MVYCFGFVAVVLIWVGFLVLEGKGGGGGSNARRTMLIRSV